MPNDNHAETASGLKLIFWLGGLFVFVAAVFLLVIKPDFAKAPADCMVNPELDIVPIQASNRLIHAEAVESGEDKARGLSGRDCLRPDSGMLFSYELSGDYCFWMKDMNFAIDIIWMDEDKRIVTIKDSVSPDSYPQSFCPDKPSKFILEIPADYASKADWIVGTQFSW